LAWQPFPAHKFLSTLAPRTCPPALAPSWQLPIYYPSEDEQKDPKLYAANVRQYMVSQLLRRFASSQSSRHRLRLQNSQQSNITLRRAPRARVNASAPPDCPASVIHSAAAVQRSEAIGRHSGGQAAVPSRPAAAAGGGCWQPGGRQQGRRRRRQRHGGQDRGKLTPGRSPGAHRRAPRRWGQRMSPQRQLVATWFRRGPLICTAMDLLDQHADAPPSKLISSSCLRWQARRAGIVQACRPPQPPSESRARGHVWCTRTWGGGSSHAPHPTNALPAAHPRICWPVFT
jgi:hypothetical protein